MEVGLSVYLKNSATTLGCREQLALHNNNSAITLDKGPGSFSRVGLVQWSNIPVI